MKKIISVLALAASVSLLTGCATLTPKQWQAENKQSSAEVAQEQTTVTACLTWVKEKETAELKQYDKLQSSDMSFALMHRETMGMIKDVWGKGNECKPGTNQWDAYIVHVRETEASHRQYADNIKSVATVGIVTTGAVKLTDAIMGKIGDKMTTTGDNSGIAKTTTNTTTNTVATAADKSSATASAPGAAGSKETPEAAKGTEVSAANWEECKTSPNGTPSADEVNGCMIGYGYPTSVKDGQIYLDGTPYNGPVVE